MGGELGDCFFCFVHGAYTSSHVSFFWLSELFMLRGLNFWVHFILNADFNHATKCHHS